MISKELLREVYMTIGAASMCWEDMPTGLFLSDKAKALGDELVARIDAEIETARADERERIFGLSDSGYLYEALSRAEVVAARLVEVICEDADTIAMLLRDFDVVVKQRDEASADERERIKAEFLAGGGSKQSAELFSIAYDRGYTDAMNDMEAFVSDLREERGSNG